MSLVLLAPGSHHSSQPKQMQVTVPPCSPSPDRNHGSRSVAVVSPYSQPNTGALGVQGPHKDCLPAFRALLSQMPGMQFDFKKIFVGQVRPRKRWQRERISIFTEHQELVLNREALCCVHEV